MLFCKWVSDIEAAGPIEPMYIEVDGRKLIIKEVELIDTISYNYKGS